MSDRARAYRNAGVDITAGNQFVANIKKLVATTFTKGVVTDHRRFRGGFKPDIANMEEPLC
jgi:phosphoribosylformylglycinamidine cyclo-ligase